MLSSLLPMIKKYKFLAIPAIPLGLFFALTLFLFFMPRDTIKKQPTQPSPTQPTESSLSNPTIAKLVEEGYDVEIEEPLEERLDFLKREPVKDTLSDGTVRYSFDSTNPERPNIIITQGEQVILFQRAVTDPAAPVSISDYTDVDGEPEKIMQGSHFYGPEAQTYIYASKGVAFIADPKTQQVLEQHLFLPMTADEYVQKYGQ